MSNWLGRLRHQQYQYAGFNPKRNKTWVKMSSSSNSHLPPVWGNTPKTDMNQTPYDSPTGLKTLYNDHILWAPAKKIWKNTVEGVKLKNGFPSENEYIYHLSSQGFWRFAPLIHFLKFSWLFGSGFHWANTPLFTVGRSSSTQAWHLGSAVSMLIQSLDDFTEGSTPAKKPGRMNKGLIVKDKVVVSPKYA